MSLSRFAQASLMLTLLVVVVLAGGCAAVPANTAVPAAATAVPEPTVAAPEPTAMPEPTATMPEPTVTSSEGEAGDLPASLDGHWEGSINVAEQEIAIRLDIAGQGGTIDIPGQSAFDLRLENLTSEGNQVRFEMLPAPNTATFAGEVAGDTMSGVYEQSGFEGTFSVTRTEVEQTTGSEAKPYREEEVTFQNSSFTLAGTLTLPEGDAPHPAIVLISGSGAQNRDEELFGFKPFAILADYLTRQGIAVLRYDDRGIGGSTTGTVDDTSETFAADVRSAVEYLKGRAEIHPAKIGLLGHSEGGIIAPMVAVETEDVAFLVMLAGPGVSGRELLPTQVGAIAKASGASQDEIDEQVAKQTRAIEAVLTGESLDEVKAELVDQMLAAAEELPESQREALGDLDEWAEEVVEQQIAVLGGPWMRFFLMHDPAPVLERVDVPVLALFGGKDTQVPAAENEAAVEAALTRGGNADFTTHVFPDANHLFQLAETGSPEEYATLAPEFAPGVLEMIGEWIVAQVGSK